MEYSKAAEEHTECGHWPPLSLHSTTNIPISLCTVPSVTSTSGSGNITPSNTNCWHWTTFRLFGMHSSAQRFIKAPSAQRHIVAPYPTPAAPLKLGTPSLAMPEQRRRAPNPPTAPHEFSYVLSSTACAYLSQSFGLVIASNLSIIYFTRKTPR